MKDNHILEWLGVILLISFIAAVIYFERRVDRVEHNYTVLMDRLEVEP